MTRSNIQLIRELIKSISNEEELCIKAGATAFLTKPIRPVELRQVINEIAIK